MEKLTIVTHEGTCTHVVKNYLTTLGHKVIVIDNQRDAYLQPFDRLILLGGCDISPFFYGEPIVDTQRGDRDRDVIEWILARRAITDNRPTLGICRGHQMLTIAHGGSLYQDMYNGLEVDHNMRQHTIKPLRKLAAHIPTKTVNSYHHQSVKTVPMGFDVMATAPDGVIESIYRPGYLGVQWHPEMMLQTDHRWGKLFDWWLEGLQ